MIKIVIIEDEKIALDNLLYHIKLITEPISVLATLDTVEDSIIWFSNNPFPDLIFMDIHLKDGISFKIFDKIKLSVPIIFITAFDNFMIEAFAQTGIEYLLKPIETLELSKSINKYKNLKNHFLTTYDRINDYISNKATSTKKRIIVKKGIEFQSIMLDDVAYIFTDQKISFLITREGKKFMVDKNLKELEEELDPTVFFRANRKFIINVNYVKSYKAYARIKIQVELTIPLTEEIIISQENALSFRKWIQSL